MFFVLNYFRKRPAVSVFLITFLMYSPLLLNRYVGDDDIIIASNTFYKSWKNIPRLFEKGYITDAARIVYNDEFKADFGTGSVSYRPASNLTYFLDWYLFQARPYGSHLINILIHSLNAGLVYWIVFQIFSSAALGVFAALLFSLHPIQSEAVAVMSYRADILAAMFVLLSFYFWIKFTNDGYSGNRYYAGSLAMFFLGVFSKESAFMLPFVIVLFDQVSGSLQLNLKRRGVYYAGFILILILHACLYFVVFPNASLALHWIGGSFVNHCLTMGLIWSGYLTNIFMPWTVKMIPGLYSPPVPAVLSLIAVQAAAFLIVAVMCLPALWRSDKKCFFFLSWYFIFYLPVSNLLPIANPMACRFMYLPSIGLLIVLAFFLNKVFVSKLVVKRFPDLSRVLFAAVLVICATRTFFLNADWKSNFDVGWACVRDYPAFARGYALLGVEFYNAGLYKEAKGYAEKSVLLKDTMPKEVLNLAKCYVQLKEFKSAESLLKQIINNEPAFIDPYVWLGIVYDEQNKVPQARQVLDKALNLDPKKFIGYKPLIKVYLEERNFKAAGDLLKKADLDLNAEKVAELRRFLKDTIAVQAKK